MIKIVLDWKKDKVLAQQKDTNGNTPLHFAASMQQYTRPLWASIVTSPTSLEYVGHPLCARSWWFLGFIWTWRVPICWRILKVDPCMAKVPNKDGMVPMHIAAMSNQWIAVDVLLKNCIRCIFLRDKQGRTFLHIAAQNNGFRVVSFVCRRSVFAHIMNIQDKNGNTALHLAVDVQNPGMVSALLRNRYVSLDIRNDKGQTALDVARSRIREGYLIGGGNPDKFIYTLLVLVGAKHGSYRWDQIQQHCIPQPKQEQDADKKEEEKQEREKEESDKLTSATQTLGIGAVLITTVTFGATFALPGGYKADDHVNGGTPTLAGHWYFDAFMVANTLAFILSSVATVGLMYSGMAVVSLQYRRIHFNVALLSAASSITSLTAAFALGVYMVLAPVARSTAIAICAVSPLVLLYKYIPDLTNSYLALITIRARIGLWSAMMYAARFVLLAAICDLWPLAVIVGWAGHLRDRRHG